MTFKRSINFKSGTVAVDANNIVLTFIKLRRQIRTPAKVGFTPKVLRAN